MTENAKHPVPANKQVWPFSTLRDRMERIFDDFARDLRPFTALDFFPDAELSEAGDRLTLALELPGIDPKDVELSVQDRTITISGEKKQNGEAKDGEVYRSERSYGAFVRSFTAPFPVDADAVEANFDKGVLTIAVPKPAGYTGRPRQIEIKH